MTALSAETVQPAPVIADGFELGYTTEDGVECRTSLAEAWAAPLDWVRPVRRFTSHKG